MKPRRHTRKSAGIAPCTNIDTRWKLAVNLTSRSIYLHRRKTNTPHSADTRLVAPQCRCGHSGELTRGWLDRSAGVDTVETNWHEAGCTAVPVWTQWRRTDRRLVGLLCRCGHSGKELTRGWLHHSAGVDTVKTNRHEAGWTAQPVGHSGKLTRGWMDRSAGVDTVETNWHEAGWTAQPVWTQWRRTDKRMVGPHSRCGHSGKELTRGWLDRTAGVDTVEKREISARVGNRNQPSRLSECSPAAIHNRDFSWTR